MINDIDDRIEVLENQIKEWLIKHDAETKTPLEEEIERLKNKLADLTEEYELTVEAFDREYATQNVQLRKAFNERNNERLKVIAELEKEKQTAVKEFAEELIKMLNKYSIKRIIKICDNVLENNINLILRKRGIE